MYYILYVGLLSVVMSGMLVGLITAVLNVGLLSVAMSGMLIGLIAAVLNVGLLSVAIVLIHAMPLVIIMIIAILIHMRIMIVRVGIFVFAFAATPTKCGQRKSGKDYHKFQYMPVHASPLSDYLDSVPGQLYKVSRKQRLFLEEI